VLTSFIWQRDFYLGLFPPLTCKTKKTRSGQGFINILRFKFRYKSNITNLIYQKGSCSYSTCWIINYSILWKSSWSLNFFGKLYEGSPCSCWSFCWVVIVGSFIWLSLTVVSYWFSSRFIISKQHLHQLFFVFLGSKGLNSSNTTYMDSSTAIVLWLYNLYILLVEE